MEPSASKFIFKEQRVLQSIAVSTQQAGGGIEERVQSFELALRNGQRNGLPKGERNRLT